jgi:carboxyl-terminal processing protease
MMLFILWLTTGLATASSSMYQRMASLISERYLLIEDLDVSEAFVSAAEEAEGDIPWLIVEPQEGGVILSHGQLGVPHPVFFEPEGAPAEAILDLPQALGRLDRAIRGIEAEIPEEVDLSVTLLKGVARALDRNSTVMAKDRLERFDERIRGRLTGIGSRIGSQDGELVIREVFEGAPSEIGGLRAGDVILRIDGISTNGMNVNQAVTRIRGEEDTVVVLQVRRMVQDGEEVLDISMTRAVVVIPNVTWESRDSGVGYIAVENFSEQTTRLMEAAVLELMTEEVDGLVVDLRGNSGGSMKQSCLAADLFLEDGVVLSTQGRDGKRVSNLMREYSASASGMEPVVPIVVLMDSSSASASEILGGVLREHERALLIGDRSHGKGTVQKVYTLRGGDEETRVRLKLTVAEYQVAGHLSIESGKGLEPNLYVETAVFGREGVFLPRLPEAGAHLIHVEELPGWRGQPAVTDTPDYLLEVAEKIILASRSGHPTDMATALEQVESELRLESDQIVMQTFAQKDVDWTRAPPGEIAPPQVDLVLEAIGELRAGNEIEIQATALNLGTQSLYRARIELSTDESSPWDGITIPLGKLSPGSEVIGSRLLSLEIDEPGRLDAITPVLIIDGVEPLELSPVDMEISALPVPHLAVNAVLLAVDDHHLVQLELENKSEQDLSGVTLRLALQDDSTVEILDSVATIQSLPAGTAGQLELEIKLQNPEQVETLVLELRVDAEFHGRVLRAPITLSLDGESTHLELPRLHSDLPPVLPVGTYALVVEAQDDGMIESVRIWLDGEKIGWQPGEGSTLRVEMPLQIDPGYHRVHMQVIDADGGRRTRLYRVRGEPS